MVVRSRLSSALKAIFVFFLAFGSVFGFNLPADSHVNSGEMTRLSQAADGQEADADSYYPAISANGNAVAFSSNATNLVSNDTLGYKDIFLRDLEAGTIQRISTGHDGSEANGFSDRPSISADGRFIAFESNANNLISGDTNTKMDIFVYDGDTGTIECVSKSSEGVLGNNISTTASISNNGRYVVFSSLADNLIEDDDNGKRDIFLHDRDTDQTYLISKNNSGELGNDNSEQPRISGNGSYVVFQSYAGNLVSDDENVKMDIFVRDLIYNETERVSLASDGEEANNSSQNPNISDDGHYVVFDSYASNLVAGDDANGSDSDVFLHDRVNGNTELVSVSSSGEQDGKPSFYPDINSDGDFVTFASDALNLVEGDSNLCTDIFLRNRDEGTTHRITITDQGGEANFYSGLPTISADGQRISFFSLASNLVAGDTNNKLDIFLNDTLDGTYFDLWVEDVSPIQVVVDNDLVRGKPTAVRVSVRKSGTAAAINVGARVQIEGGDMLNSFYVNEESNLSNTYKLLATNDTYSLDFSSGNDEKVLYFILPDSPVGSSFQVSAIIDPLDNYAEWSEINNEKISEEYDVIDTQWGAPGDLNFELYYFRVDWGEMIFTPFSDFFDYSTHFIAGVWPVAPDNLYTQRSTLIENTTNFRGEDNLLDSLELSWFLAKTLQGLELSLPQTDRFVAVVRPIWFTVNTPYQNAAGFYNQMLRRILIGESEFDSSYPNDLPSIVHEMGHSYGLALDCEEYDINCNPGGAGIGNPSGLGFWVEERIPMEIQPLSREIFCFMGRNPSQTSYEYWIDASDYTYLLSSNKSQIAEQPDQPAASTEQAILTMGIIETSDNVTLEEWYILPDVTPDNLPPGDYSYEYRDESGMPLSSLSFDVSFSANWIGSAIEPLDQTPFLHRIPYVPGTASIVIKHQDTPLAEVEVSDNSPQVSLSYPNGGEMLHGQVLVQWTGSDLDGDDLTYALLYSPDNGLTWNTIAHDLEDSSYTWDTSDLPTGEQYIMRVLATDGFNTTSIESSGPFSINETLNIFLPMVLE